MKSQKLFDAIGNIGEDLIEGANAPRPKAKLSRRVFITSAAAAVLAIVIIAVAILSPKDVPSILTSSITSNTSSQETQSVVSEPNSNLGSSSVSRPSNSSQTHSAVSKPANTTVVGKSFKAFAVKEAVYPTQVHYPNYGGKYDDQYIKALDAWRQDHIDRQKNYNITADLNPFLKKSIPQFLSGKDGENIVYSPINVYMALSMLSEICGGESRSQLLSLLGADSIEALRHDATSVWNANYSNDGRYTSILASSLWLNQNINFKKQTLETLKETYYASSFKGKMGSAKFDKALQDWLNDQTGNLLKGQIDSIKMPPETVLSLATTVCFKAGWDSNFSEMNTKKNIFKTANGDVTCDFMNRSSSEYYYYSENFSATSKSFTGGGSMFFILPDENKTPEELLKDVNALDFICSGGKKGAERQKIMVNLSVPKFDVSSQIKLKDGLKALGVTDVFDFTKSNFSPLTDDTDVAVSSALHGARVKIDEEGCTAAAYTAMLTGGSAKPPEDEVDFVLDRPFIFVITSPSGQPLFVGIVNTPA